MTRERECCEHAVTLLTISLTEDLAESPVAQDIFYGLDEEGLVWLCAWLTNLADTFVRAAAIAKLRAEEAEASDEAVTQTALSMVRSAGLHWAQRYTAED
jgi:hypothetical protein